MIALSDYVFRRIAELGVGEVFLLPGGGCMHLVDSLGREKSLRYVCCLHEQAAAIAAAAHAEFRNEIGVALVTSGPGGTNAITGVASAWIDSVPLMILSGQVKREDMIGESRIRQLGNQEVDIVGIVKPITKYAVTVIDPLSIRYHVEKAFHLARSDRPGPVWLDVPLDVQGATIDTSSLDGFTPQDASPSVGGDYVREKAAEAVELLKASTRPVILAGNGVRLAGAEREFVELIGKLGIPILTTWKAIDLLAEDHPLFVGRPGAIGQRGANFAQQNSDWILCLGSRLDKPQIGYSHDNFARASRRVVVDVDPHEIDKLKMRIDVPIAADARLFVEEFARNISGFRPEMWAPWLARCKDWQKRYPPVPVECWDSKEHVNTYAFVDLLSDLMCRDDVLVPGSSGSCSEITMQAFRVKAGQRILNSPGLGAMGFGLPSAIGACLASGRKRTILIVGDGGLQLNMQELETLRRLALPVKCFILNNRGFASIKTMQTTHFQSRFVCCDAASGLTVPSAARIAAAYGLPFCSIASHRRMRGNVRAVLDAEGPVLCEIMVDPLLRTAPRLASEVRSDGGMTSKPLEDLWPYLDRNEFRSNMIIEPLGE